MAGGLRRPVYLAFWPGLAEYYATTVAESLGDPGGVVLEVLADTATLMADMNSLIEPVMGIDLDRDDVVKALTDLGELVPQAFADARALDGASRSDYEEYLSHADLKPHEWQRSLVLTGAVVSVGADPIRPRDIQPLYEVESGIEEPGPGDDEETIDVGGRRSLGAAVRARLGKSDLQGLLDEARLDAWDEGGCWPLAFALKRWLGRFGRLKGIYTANGLLQHAVVMIRTAGGERYLDSRGAFTARQLLADWQARFAEVFRKHPETYPPRIGMWNPQAALRYGFGWCRTAPLEAALQDTFGKPEDWGLVELPDPGTAGRRGRLAGGSVGGRSRKPTQSNSPVYSRREAARGRRFDPADPQCAPSPEEVSYWTTARRTSTTVPAVVKLLMSMPPELSWQAFGIMLDMARERLALTPAMRTALERAGVWVAQQRDMVDRVTPEVHREVLVGLDVQSHVDRLVWAALAYFLRARREGNMPPGTPSEVAYNIAIAVADFAYALAWQAHQVALDSPGKPPTLYEATTWFIACWADRVKKRFAFVQPPTLDPGSVDGRRPTRRLPYSHPTARARRVNPTATACSPSGEAIKEWAGAVREWHYLTKLAVFLFNLSPVGAWRATAVAIDYARSRIALDEQLDGLGYRAARMIEQLTTLEPGWDRLTWMRELTGYTRPTGAPAIFYSGVARLLGGPWLEDDDRPVAELTGLDLVQVLANTVTSMVMAAVWPADEPDDIGRSFACWMDLVHKRMAFVLPDEHGALSG